jgi:hypothetical protein
MQKGDIRYLYNVFLDQTWNIFNKKHHIFFEHITPPVFVFNTCSSPHFRHTIAIVHPFIINNL